MIDKKLKSKIADIIMEAIEEYNSNELNRPMIASVYAGEIISFINSLPEEPVSEDLEKEIDRAHRIFYDEVGWDSDEGARAYVADWFAHYFANWQKHHMEVNRIKHCNSISKEQAELEQKFLDEHLDKYNRMPTFLDAIEYGMRLQKEQMMEQAVDAGCFEFHGAALFSFRLPSDRYLVGSKVKVIVIKED